MRAERGTLCPDAPQKEPVRERRAGLHRESLGLYSFDLGGKAYDGTSLVGVNQA